MQKFGGKCMTLVLELPHEFEEELLAYWKQAGLLQVESDSSNDQPQAGNTHNNLNRFRLPNALHDRLQDLLDRQDAGEVLTAAERLEAESLVELAEFPSLLHLRALRIAPSM
jgi:hypothetical protein